MDYTIETARRLAEELRAIPAKDPAQRRLDKQAMVRELAEELIALQQRGYTMEEVGENLRGREFEITTPTLKNYLQRAKNTSAQSRKPRRRPASPTRSKHSADSRPPHAEATSDPSSFVANSPGKPESEQRPTADPTPRSGKTAFLIKDKESY